MKHRLQYGEELISFDYEEKYFYYSRTKRITDLVISFIGLLFFLLIFPFIALGIKLSSKGPVIFKQDRTGYKGQSFICYKFRTMHIVNQKSENKQPIITQKGDPRIFRFGQWLRKMNLDELPQVINVLKGEMSLVGPRPYPVEEAEHWNHIFQDFHARYTAKPGLSGLAQIKGYRGGTLDRNHMERRLYWDLYYVGHQDIKMDLYVMWHTLLQMIKFETNAH